MKEIIIIAGANGSGKTTFSKQILIEKQFEFLNADEIEKDLKTNKLMAGKEFFNRLNILINQDKSFVLESTLSGKYLLKYLLKAKNNDYIIKIVYIFLETPFDCIQRIKIRVKLGGHFVPDDDVIRRFYRSKRNFWNEYKKLANNWLLFYNSNSEEPQRIALGSGDSFVVELESIFIHFIEEL